GTLDASEKWVRLVPQDARERFTWPTPQEREDWLRRKGSAVILVGQPKDQLGVKWDFYRVFESIADGEYDLLGCERVSPTGGEIRIDPHAYPYGGLGPFIALVEAYGFSVVGVNESGRYQPREELVK